MESIVCSSTRDFAAQIANHIALDFEYSIISIILTKMPARSPQNNIVAYIIAVIVVYILFTLFKPNPRPPSQVFVPNQNFMMDDLQHPGPGHSAILPHATASNSANGREAEIDVKMAGDQPKALSVSQQDRLKDLLPTLERVVHLDLKGAAPKISYLEKFFPLLRDFGATGLLVEWEDMFPYDGDLVSLSAYDCYSKEDVKQIHRLAKQSGLFIIPLVQTFGHMEFVLKGPEFKHLREDAKKPQVINPHKEESKQLLHNMINQQMALQPDVQYFHIGADEVWGLGVSEESKHQMENMGLTKDRMFLNHVREVAGYIKNSFPLVEIMMWDDMFRSTAADEIRKSRIDRLVTPVIWKYTADVDDVIKPNILLKYSQLFHSVWIASAFKGATGSAQYITDISYHFNNHRAWQRVLVSDAASSLNVKGTMFTGWQRYDHFAVLCELLPVGLPSLAVCLSTMLYVGISEDLKLEINKKLGCSASYPIQWSINTKATSYPQCTFPGHEIFEAAYELKNAYYYVNYIENKQGMLGWHSDYMLKHKFSQTFRMDNLKEKCDSALAHLSNAENIMKRELPKYFSEETTVEWVESHITPVKEKMAKKKKLAEEVLSVDVWPRRPLHKL